MTQSDLIQILILIVLVYLSGYFSSAETALSTVSRVTLKTQAAEGDERASLTLDVLSDYSKMISAILVCNNIVNLSASSLSTTLMIHLFGEGMVSVGTIILTVIILIFGEVTPKNTAKIQAVEIAKKDAPVIKVLMVILTPVIFIIDKFSLGIMKLKGVNTNKTVKMTENELKTYMEVGRKDGVIEGGEKRIIDNVFDFGDAVAKEIMVPRIDMKCVSEDATYDEVMNVFRKDMFTRIPVYAKNSPDQIIGHINVKDFIRMNNPSRFNIHRMLHESYYTYEYKKTTDLLKEMQQNSMGIAFVLDEYGNTVGMLTLEDLVEQIVGNIRDEYDEDEQKEFHKYDDKTYLVDGSMKLMDLNTLLGTSFESEDYDSIGGLIIEQLDRIPENGETVTLDDGTILETKGLRRNRIVKVLIRFSEVPKTVKEAKEQKQQEEERLAIVEEEQTSLSTRKEK